MATKVSSTKFNVVHHGRIYLTDERLCFGSDILGIKNKVKLEFTKITAISKTKILGLFDTGILINYDKDKLYTIGGFQSRELALKRIKAIWTARARVSKPTCPGQEKEKLPE